MKNSTPSSSTDPASEPKQTVCPLCGGAGFLRRDLPVNHPDFGKIVPCDCHTQEIKNRQMKRLRSISNLDQLEHYTFQTFNPEGYGITPSRSKSLAVAYQEAKDFAQHPHGWLVLLGGYGVGKTHLAAGIANAIIRQEKSALFIVVPDLLDHLKATFSPHSTVAYDKRFEEIRNAPVLILDDLGTQASTPWAQEKLFQLFNHRYNARLATVVTSNHSLEDIDRRIRSRMVDPDLSRVITIVAPDFRGGGETLSELSTLSQHEEKTFNSFDSRANELERQKAENLRQAFNLAQNYAGRPTDWILFTGPYGCGKTQWAAAIANEQSLNGRPALFIVVPDLLDHLRAAFSPTSVTPYDKRFEEIRNAPFLVLDDLGTQSATAWAQEKLYQLFNHRYNARLPTVITMADVGELDPRLKSRLLDVGRCTAFAITAPSYRGAPSIRSDKKRASRPRRSASTKNRGW